MLLIGTLAVGLNLIGLCFTSPGKHSDTRSRLSDRSPESTASKKYPKWLMALRAFGFISLCIAIVLFALYDNRQPGISSGMIAGIVFAFLFVMSYLDVLGEIFARGGFYILLLLQGM